MSETSSSFGMPSGSIRAGFEAAARAHQSLRDGQSTRAMPAMRPMAAPGTPVEAAIANAARQTSVDFGFLLAQAKVESALDPDARAATSSATGLYQFIDSTWLDTVKKHGPRFGLGAMADEIAVGPSGSAFVDDPERRAAILALRNDPEVASLMAAGLAEDNRARLTPILGREPDHAELYLAHFLGAGGAGRFLAKLQANPHQSAPALFARPAAANRAIFHAPDGSPRSLAQVMDVIANKLERAGADPSASGTGAGFTPAPYIIADEAVFSPGQPIELTGGGARSASRPPMSQVLGMAFGTDRAAAPAQVRRAYDTLRAFGL